MSNIRLLDCTLRDGGHLTGGNYGEATIKNTVNHLVDAGVDIIEVGFMWDEELSSDYTRFYSMNDVKKILPPKDKYGKSKFSVMIEKQNLLDHIEDYDGSIEYVRIIFKRKLIDWAMDQAKAVIAKGYKVFMNPVNCSVYTDAEYCDLIKKINEVHPYAMSIVDTFGVLRMEEFCHRFELVQANLDKDITIGVHLHENLGQAYTMAQRVTEMADPKRNIVIDGSVLGMGRDPGNLKIEQIAEYMNYKYGTDYNLDAIYDAITNEIGPLQEKYQWGYKLPYAMSAYYKLHRTYPEFLMGKPDLSMKDIDHILSQVAREESEYYNEAYIEGLYQDYINAK
ncbi:MAG: hypothetical protein K5773_08190 [Pseudobutyrivibrio sp.]|nr:hypothetical protein [Pseudobutyrivibrio sp.]